MQSIHGFYATLSVGAALKFENGLPGLRHQMAPLQWVVTNVGGGTCLSVGDKWAKCLTLPTSSYSLICILQPGASPQDSGGDLTGNSQLEVQSVYFFTRICSFLQETKGMRLVKVEEFFPDLQLFLDLVKYFSKKTQDASASRRLLTKQLVLKL